MMRNAGLARLQSFGLFAAVLLAAAAHAQPAPAFRSAFGSRMVLPAGTAFSLSGYSAANTELTLTVDGKSYPFRSNRDGTWAAEVGPLAAGGPYDITLTDAAGGSAALTDVLAGRLWLCSGQSNMEFGVAQSVDQPEDYNNGHPAIRLLTTPRSAVTGVETEFPQAPEWQMATDESVRRFSAVCYFLARQLLERDGIPIGLVNASWGGSGIEAWIGEDALEDKDEYRTRVELLRLYRENPRAAELAFGDEWERWWLAGSDAGAVWEQGVLDGNPDWRPAALGDWRAFDDARLPGFTGSLWYSRSFELTAAQSRKGATFVLGRIDEIDTTWVNGEFVNNSFGFGTPREYPLGAGMLRPGTNQFTVNIVSTYDAGGMLGPDQQVGIRFDDGEFIDLSAGWQYQIVPSEIAYPPRSPWESVHGVAGMYNGMIAPLEPLHLAGVIWYQGESNVRDGAIYEDWLNTMIADWRKLFSQPELPFIIVQLPNNGPTAVRPEASGWAEVRHAQQQVALADDRIGLVVTHDLGDDDDIHPRLKFAVAERAANVAHAFGDGDLQDGVVPRIVGNDRNTVTIEFSPPLAPVAEAVEVEGFILCPQRGSSSGCSFTRAVQNGTRIEVRRGTADAEVIRFCWSDGGQCGLTSASGLPVSSFEVYP
jgi:sialate O-acetylesterase